MASGECAERLMVILTEANMFDFLNTILGDGHKPRRRR